jgi:type 1 glutamine amidotransferase
MPHPPAPKAMVVVNGDDLRHDLLSAAEVFRQLGTEAGFATRKAMGTSRFADPRPETAEADVYLLYTAGGQFAAHQQRALAAAVASGKGLVGVHCANALRHRGGELDPADRALFELLGSRRLPDGGGHEGRHTARITADHPVTRGVTDFDVFDEYDGIELADDALTVLARGRGPDGASVPLLYVREAGAGRVVYLTLGHDMRSWGEPPVRALVRQALRWAARREGADGESGASGGSGGGSDRPPDNSRRTHAS